MPPQLSPGIDVISVNGNSRTKMEISFPKKGPPGRSKTHERPVALNVREQQQTDHFINGNHALCWFHSLVLVFLAFDTHLLVSPV